MQCPKCGRENINNAKYCQYCGANLYERDDGSKAAKIAPLLLGALAILLIVIGGYMILRGKNGEPAKSNEQISQTTDQSSQEQNTEQEKTTSQQQYVIFNDPALERAVRDAMGIHDHDITIEEAEKETKLDLSSSRSGGQIEDLSGLSYFCPT